MNKHEQVFKIIKKWRRVLYLHQWNFTVSIQSRPSDSDDEIRECPAEITADPVYSKAIIKIFPCFWKLRKEDKEAVILHELCHCITQPAKNGMRDLMDGFFVTKDSQVTIIEQMTQRIADIAIQIKP